MGDLSLLKESVRRFEISSDEEVAVPKTDISDHWGPEYRERVEMVLEKHQNLFRPGLGRFNDGIEMPIRFKDESDVAGLKQNPFNLSQRDRRAMDSILDPLVEEVCVAFLQLHPHQHLCCGRTQNLG